jgi:thiol-disulfide isomerase/thioredoxin
MIQLRLLCCINKLCLFIGFVFSTTLLGQGPPGEQPESLVLYFQSENCQPCRQLEPLLLDYLAKGWDIRKVDATRQLDLSQQYRIENLPTLVLLHGGKEIDRIVGLVSSQQLQQRMLRALARQQGSLPKNSGNDSSAVASPGVSLSGTPNARAGFADSAVAAGTGPVLRGQSPDAASAGYPLLASRSPEARSAMERHDDTRTLDTNSPTEETRRRAESSLNEIIAKTIDATVRIKVEESNTIGYGTGTVVATYQGEALVLTCGHLFRDMLPGSQLKVDLFAGTPRQTTVLAQLIDFKADKADVGLISFRMPVTIEPVAMLPKGESVQVGQNVFSIGCDHGKDPSRRDTRITHVNRYLGPSNLEISGAPAVGRSGGGLFDTKGRLIGVCNAACNQDDEGIYAAAEVIYEQLARIGQSHLFDNKTNSAVDLTSPSLAESEPSVNSSLVSRSQQTETPTRNDSVVWPDEPAQPSKMVRTEDGLSNLGPAPSGEVQLICVLRDSSGSDRVVTINRPSMELLRTIESHGDRVANR